jgi:hypothetical protein
MTWTRIAFQILVLVLVASPLVAQDEAPRFSSDVDSLKALTNALRDSVVEKRNRLIVLNQMLQDSVHELHSVRARSERQERVLQARRDSIDQLAVSYEGQQRVARELKTDLDTVSVRRDYLTKALASLNAELVQIKLVYTELRIRTSGLTQDLERERTELQKQVVVARQLETTIQNKDSVAAFLRQERDRKDMEIAEQRDSLAARDGTIASIKKQAGADKQRYEKQLSFLRSGLRWAVLAATSITFLLFAIAAVAAYQDHKSDMTKPLLNKFGLVGTESPIALESVRLWVWYRAVSRGLQYFLVLGVVLVCGLIALLFAFLLQTGATGINLLSMKEFWQAVGATGVPLVFLVTAHNTVETRRLELAKLLCEIGKGLPGPPTDKAISS